MGPYLRASSASPSRGWAVSMSKRLPTSKWPGGRGIGSKCDASSTVCLLPALFSDANLRRTRRRFKPRQGRENWLRLQSRKIALMMQKGGDNSCSRARKFISAPPPPRPGGEGGAGGGQGGPDDRRAGE